MKKQPAQKIAIVTGGASGIGKAIAGRFVDERITTIIIGRDTAKLETARKQFGANCHTISFDLTNISGIPGLVNEIIHTYGHVDILVNNAGINMKKDFTDV